MSAPVDQQVSVGAVIVLAAGGGTRMKSKRSKLLHEVCGRSMLSYAIQAAQELQPDRLMVVVGHEREQVIAHLGEVSPAAQTAVQEQQNGTGDAVRCGLEALGDVSGEVVVTYGDVPLLSGGTLIDLVADHRAKSASVTVLTARVADPTGYGRIVRDDSGQIAAIVEHRDATSAQREIDEINSGIYVFDAAVLRSGIASLQADNAQGELYLTDVIAFARQSGGACNPYETSDVWQTEGVNDRVQLAAINAELNRRILHRWMLEGVTIIDPVSTWIETDVDLAPDVTLLPGVILQGATSVASGATIGPETTLKDVEVCENATIIRSHCELAVIGEGANVGPYARIRPGTQLAAGGKIGTFVETKNAVIGEGAKVPHLCYCGDAVIGEGANIGAGTIFANYDGHSKFGTHVGKQAFIGSNSVLVAPVDVSDGAFVAAGSAITGDVAPGALAVARGRQRILPGWVERTRGNSKAAEAARGSTGEVAQNVVESRARLQKGDA